MDQVLHASRYFTLKKRNHKDTSKRGKGKAYYELKITGFMNDQDLEAVRNVVDPQRNKGGRYARHWRWREVNTPQKLLTFLLLKWN